MSKKLYMFVENFSTAQREEFFEKELPFLCERFEKVILLPLYKGNTDLSYSNPRIEIKQFDVFGPCNRLRVFCRHFFLVMRMFAFELRHTHNRPFYLKNWTSLLNVLTLRIASALALEKEIGQDLQGAVFYTYWFNQWTLVLSIIMSRHPSMKLVSRAHGSDYKEEQTGTTLAFRYYQLDKINYVFPVSYYAKNYLEQTFGLDPSKIVVNHLGLATKHELATCDGGNLVLVSCSSIIPLKRVHLIPQILKYIKTPVTWYHFGHGPAHEAIEAACAGLPGHVQYMLRGYVPNEALLEFLKKNSTSFFINVSQYEGVPVTLMEAAGLGIPLIGTDVGGVSEIVTPVTGHLIPENFDPETVAGYIQHQHQGRQIYDLELRRSIQRYYNENFSSEKNYSIFADTLHALN